MSGFQCTLDGDITYVSPRWISSHFFPTLVPTLPIHPAVFGDRGDLTLVGDSERLVVEATPMSTCTEDLCSGLDSESFDLRRRLALADRGEMICTASAIALGFPSEDIGMVAVGSSSTGSSKDNVDMRDEAEDWESL